jgi:hypothetical protein
MLNPNDKKSTRTREVANYFNHSQWLGAKGQSKDAERRTKRNYENSRKTLRDKLGLK